ncbi:hypothetical protein KQH40_00680 [bacterium]|nr:hypothetical protein [bacterium]
MHQVSKIGILIIFSLLFLLFFSSCNSESEFPSRENSSEILDFQFCSTIDGICDDEESKDTFNSTEWDTIVACGIMKIDGASSVPLRPHWKDSTGALITTGSAEFFSDNELVCFSFYDSINYQATIIDGILNTNVIEDGKMEPGLYYLEIKEYREVKSIIAFTIKN